LIFDLLALKVVSESHVTWATSVPILVFIGLSVLDLGSMYATDRQTAVRQHHRLMPPPRGWGIIKMNRTKLGTDRRRLYICFFHDKMTNDCLAIKVMKMPLQKH